MKERIFNVIFGAFAGIILCGVFALIGGLLKGDPFAYFILIFLCAVYGAIAPLEEVSNG